MSKFSASLKSTNLKLGSDKYSVPKGLFNKSWNRIGIRQIEIKTQFLIQIC